MYKTVGISTEGRNASRFVYVGQKDARLQATAFRRAFDTLSLSGQELLLSRLSGNLRWAETLLKGSAANEGES